MKKSNRKGFTIVELVIVIAVIAILAAVLIPTFSNLIKKANQSSDIQAARQMNTILAAEQGIGDNIDKVIDVLVANGYSANGLTPVTADHKFYYVVEYERIVLVDTKKNEVVFPADVELTADSVKYDLSESVKYIDVVANDTNTLAGAFSIGSEVVKLEADITVRESLQVAEGVVMALDLNGKTLSGELLDGSKHANVISNYGNVTITNGTIATRNIFVQSGSELTVGEGATIKALDTDGGACLWIYENAKVTINSGAKLETVSFTYAVKNTGGNLIINGGDFTATRGVIAADNGTTTINGGTFATVEGADAHVLYAYDGTIEVNGGTFTGTISGSAESIVINGGTFSVDPTTWVAAGKTVTNNNDGTWTVQ